MRKAHIQMMSFRTVLLYADLTKPRISLLLLAVALGSFLLGSDGTVDPGRMLWLTAGIWLLAAGLFALNQYMEQNLDARMRRTRTRPLPAGDLEPAQALRFGLGAALLSFSVFGLRFGWLLLGLAVFTLVSYLFVYTPLKPRTSHHTTLGALSGAMPTLLGWAAATGDLASTDAWVLFAILFFWQFPHFLAIETVHLEDYRQAGVQVLPVADPEGGRTGRLVLSSLFLLSAATVAPVLTGLVLPFYLMPAAFLDAAFLYAGIRMVRDRTRRQARLLLLASVAYLPLLFAFLLAGAAG